MMQSPVFTNYNEGKHFTGLKVMQAAEGFYIGTARRGDAQPGPRESDHYRTRPEAAQELARREAMTPDQYRVELYGWAVQTGAQFIRVALEGSLSREMQAALGPDEMNSRWKAIIASPDPVPLYAAAVADVKGAKDAYHNAAEEHRQAGLEVQNADLKYDRSPALAAMEAEAPIDSRAERLAMIERQQDAAARMRSQLTHATGRKL